MQLGKQGLWPRGSCRLHPRSFAEYIGARSGPGSVQGLGIPLASWSWGCVVGASDQNMEVQVNAIESTGMDSRDRVMGVRFELDDSQGLSEKGHRDTPNSEREPAAGSIGVGQGEGQEGELSCCPSIPMLQPHTRPRGFYVQGH